MPLGGSGNAAGAAQAQEKQREAAIASGMATINKDFSTFTPKWFDQAATDYTNYATPQTMSQYQNTKNNLAYALARNGLTTSGAAATEGAALEKSKQQNLSTIANQAQNTENTLRTNVAAQKSNVVNELESSADPSAAAVQASSAVAGLSAPQAFQPIGQMFSDYTNTYLANQNAMAFNPQQQSIWGMLTGGGGYGSGTGGAVGSARMTP